MAEISTTDEHAEILRVHAENERACGRFGCAEQLDAAADHIERLRTEVETYRMRDAHSEKIAAAIGAMKEFHRGN